MRPRASQLFPVLLMLGLALGTLWLEQLVQLPEIGAKDRARHDPDFIVENFTIQRMNAAGAPESSLVAARMIHYPDDETTDLEKPRFLQRTPDQPPIEAVSERGTITKDGETVYLKDNVVVTRAGTDGRPPMVMTTSLLEVEPRAEIARTDRPVTIVEGDSQLEGVGMEVHSKTRQFELHARVRGVYQPATKQ